MKERLSVRAAEQWREADYHYTKIVAARQETDWSKYHGPDPPGSFKRPLRSYVNRFSMALCMGACGA